MADTCAFLDVTLCRFEHAAQLIQALLSPVHVVVRDEISIARRQRGKNEVSGQLLAKWEAQLLQPLCVTNHLDYMRPYWCSFCYLSFSKGLGHIEPFSPGLSLEHVP